MESLGSFVSFTSSLSGRDKLYRLVQYTLKVITHVSKENDLLSELILQQLGKLHGTLSMTRKCLRFGKTADNLYGAMKAEAINDKLLKRLIISSKLISATYTFYDNLEWLVSIGAMKGDAAKYSAIATPMWFWSIVINIVRDFYEFRVIVETDDKHRKLEWKKLLDRPEVLLDLTRNVFDVLVCLNQWKKIQFSQGYIGLFGIISTCVSIIEIKNPKLKLKPS